MKLEGYSKILKIGEGGMAHVYRGIQDSLQRPVAIKLLIPEELNLLILQCLQENPNQCPDSAGELKTRLLAISQGAHINKE